MATAVSFRQYLKSLSLSSYFLRCVVLQDESKLFAINSFCKNVHPIEKNYNMLSWRRAKFVANQTTIYCYMALGFSRARPSLENFVFSKPSQPQQKNCHLRIMWIQKCCLGYHFLNCCRLSFSELQLIVVASFYTRLYFIFHSIFHMCRSVM